MFEPDFISTAVQFVDGKIENDVGCLRPAGNPIQSLDDGWAKDKFIRFKEN